MRVLGIDLMDLTPLHEESENDVRYTTSCCSDSGDEDNDDSAVKSAGSTMPTSIPQRVPLCLEPITTRDRVMRMEERVSINPGILWRKSVVKMMPQNKLGLAQRTKNSLTAALGCCINLVRVLSKNDASLSRDKP